MPPSEPLTYAAAGVDTKAGDRAVELMMAAVKRTHGGRVVPGGGGFAGLIDASELLQYRRPLLASSTDGVGTKVAIAQTLDVHSSVGLDLVGMVVDDLVVCGARPLAMTDYIATGQVVPERIAAIVSGIAAGCEQTGTVLVGGETAEHPGLLEPNEYDIAGAAVGVVEADAVLGPERVQAGDVIIGLASSGLHSNGYSLVRAIIAQAGWELDRDLPEYGTSLGQVLLEPTRLYTQACLKLIAALNSAEPAVVASLSFTSDAVTAVGPSVNPPVPALHAFSHVTGGGLADNLARVIPAGLDAVVRRGAWTVPPIFAILAAQGDVSWDAAERTWNLGIGMIAIVAPDAADQAVTCLAAAGQEPTIIGHIIDPTVSLDPAEGARPQDLTSGTKGITGGRVIQTGSYRLSA